MGKGKNSKRPSGQKSGGQRPKETAQQGGTSPTTLLAAGAVVLVVALVGYLQASAGSGCTDPSALNYNPDATRDNGSCEGSMYSLSGVYEVQTKAAGEDLQACGMEFDVMGTTSLVKDVVPGSAAWVAEVQVADELLALRDEQSLLVVSGRGKGGLMEAVYKTVDARVGSTLTWVLRKATETGMADAMLGATFDENEQVLPSLDLWQESRQREWSAEDTQTRAFANPDRDDLRWCNDLTPSDPSVAELSGRYVLAELGARAEGRLRSVVVGRGADAKFDVEITVHPTNLGYDIPVVAAIRLPTKTQCCAYNMVTSKYAYSEIKVGDEVLSIGALPDYLS